jgi:hypothetical protein
VGGRMIAGSEYRAYLQDEFAVSPITKVNAGLHFSAYYTGGQLYRTVEPRLNVRFLLSPSVSLKTSFATMTQYLHVLSAANVSLPSDLWLPVTNQIKPMSAWQVSLGPEWEISNGFALSLEGYYKKTSNLIDYKENQSFFDFSSGWSSKLTSGSSDSYGLELLLHRKIGALTGWLGYTWSKSISCFSDLNQGQPFRSNNDRRHDGSLFLSYLFSPKVDASLSWAYGSGKPVTLANQKYVSPVLPTSLNATNGYVENYSSKNGYTMPAFHRLDLGMNFYKDTHYGKRVWSVGLMNAYGRQNPFFIYFSTSAPDENGEVKQSLKQFSMFPIPIPYVRFTIHF